MPTEPHRRTGSERVPVQHARTATQRMTNDSVRYPLQRGLRIPRRSCTSAYRYRWVNCARGHHSSQKATTHQAAKLCTASRTVTAALQISSFHSISTPLSQHQFIHPKIRCATFRGPIVVYMTSQSSRSSYPTCTSLDLHIHQTVVLTRSPDNLQPSFDNYEIKREPLPRSCASPPNITQKSVMNFQKERPAFVRCSSQERRKT
jgi:hypothetical protein